MRKEKVLYIILGILFVTYVVVEYYKPKPLDWTVTFSEKDKNPFGGFILYDRLEDFYADKKISYQTISELRDSTGNILILTDNFNLSQTDYAALKQILEKGRSVFIASSIYPKYFLDSLGISYTIDILESKTKDSTEVHFNNNKMKLVNPLVQSYFNKDEVNEWNILAEAEGPVLISKKIGEATLTLSTIPLLFSNFGLLQSDRSADLAAISLRQLPEGNVVYNRFYKVGKPEPTTPLRFMLSQESLRWGLYLFLVLLLSFIVIRSRRIQRVIPILERNINTTVEFIRTIGGLHYREGDHKNAAMKIIHRFLKTLAVRYYIHTYNEKNYQVLAVKSGIPVEEVIKTFDLINNIKSSDKISENKLKHLYQYINKFKL